MGIISLQSFLENICYNTPWNYAVFWKLNCRQEMIFSWEDYFCEDMKSKLPLGRIEDVYFGNLNKTLSSNLHSPLLDGIPGEYLIGFAVAEMSSASHVFGSGVLREVAFSGILKWIYSDRNETDMFDFFSGAEYPDELLLQFVAGIKTILLLPVLPHGVLQLGSVEMVAEDDELVINVIRKFESYNRFTGCEDESHIHKYSLMTEEDQNSFYSLGTEEIKICAGNQMIPAYTVQDLCKTLAAGAVRTNEKHNVNGCLQSSGMVHIDDARIRSLAFENATAGGTDPFNNTCFDEMIMTYPCHGNSNWMKCCDHMNEPGNFTSEEGKTEHKFADGNFDCDLEETGGNFLSFLYRDELPIPLEPAVVGNSDCMYDSSFSDHYVDWSSINVMDLTSSMDVSGVKSAISPLNDHSLGQHFEAVVSDSYISFDDGTENHPRMEKATPLYLASPIMKRSASWEEERKTSNISTSFVGLGINTETKFCSSTSSIESSLTELTGKNPQKNKRNGYGSPIPAKGLRLSSNKRTISSVNNQKPRPRDRQLIQDRVKELRELVPNSDNCSIDGLLEKTVKHILFLKEVTNKADKLRDHVLEEENNLAAKRSHGHQSRTSPAAELEEEHNQCPIFVKDLDLPGQMLIEMLCTDHGRFLEIANVIQRLQLTILKAVMEKCSENSRARFIVEASESFHRLDIFWPLMQLLQYPIPLGQKT